MKSVFPWEQGNCFCYKDNVTCWHSDTIIQPLKQLLFLFTFAGVIVGWESQM